ncbi:MAG: Large-conductance mechanosensitive channel MscMJLR [Methanomethylovorans sp. PtaU1.Bin093]|uniref:mechanosensitive ion channel family protein n=1 Tax=Methanomethylovorans sp. PtaU1.Bin093 TaxID=1811679 RepID=UPI0009C6A93F|nr:mechanosensitive ion channel family protein [Methanomethylovorans sp. PtaU1.Bin093]OPY18511.1 MAG: Large-conductance mechanosensitive channel MscMJLR [Methanomethylovorans sp. PtaU1.Bin093]
MNITLNDALFVSLSDYSILFFRIMFVASVVIISMIAGKILSIYLMRALQDKMDRKQLSMLLKLMRYSFVFFVTVFFILPFMGVELSSLLVAGGVLGIILGIAGQSIVANLISGIFLTLERPIKIGDQVNIDNNAGVIEDITFVSTIIRTFDGLYVRVPNDKVFLNNITNYAANVARRFEYVIGITYDSDADKAIGMIKGIIDDDPIAFKNPAPTVFVDKLDDNGVNIFVRIWAPSTEWYSVKTRLLWIIKKTLEENGIKIALPQRTLWFANSMPANLIESGENDLPIFPSQ